MTTKLPESGWDLPSHKAITSLVGGLAKQIDSLSEINVLNKLREREKKERDEAKRLGLAGESGNRWETMTPQQLNRSRARANIAKEGFPESMQGLISTAYDEKTKQEQADEQLARERDRYSLMQPTVLAYLRRWGSSPEEAEVLSQNFVRPLLKGKALSNDAVSKFLLTDPRTRALNNFLSLERSFKESDFFKGEATGLSDLEKQNIENMGRFAREAAQGDPAILDILLHDITGRSDKFGDALIGALMFSSGTNAQNDVPRSLDENEIRKWAESHPKMNPVEAKSLLMMQLDRFKKGAVSPPVTARIQQAIRNIYGDSYWVTIASRIKRVGELGYLSEKGAQGQLEPLKVPKGNRTLGGDLQNFFKRMRESRQKTIDELKKRKEKDKEKRERKKKK